MSEELVTIGKQLQLFHHCEPTNGAEARQEFLRTKREPAFTYPPLECNPTALRERLDALTFNSELKPLFEQARDALRLQLAILEHRGTARVRDAALQLYGRPDEETLALAKSILQSPAEETPKSVPASEIKAALEAALADYGLTTWRVEYAAKNATTVDAMNRRITLNEERRFAEQDRERLPAHEVGVHVLRSENGRLQPASIFVTGLPGYMETEEGIAAYAEALTGTALPESRRALAGHVLAVDALHRGCSFAETYALLVEQFSGPEAWRLTLRSYRAGGLAKDHAYLQGLQRVKRFLADGGDLRSLYVGKVGIEHLSLLPAGLAPPQHLPRWL